MLLALVSMAGLAIPLSPGVFWEYLESFAERKGEIRSITEETTRFEVRGTVLSPYILQTGGADPVSGPVETGDDWIRIPSFTGEDALPLPLEVGRKGPAGEDGSAWTVEAEEEVTVPAGVFRALRCALRTATSVSVLWIAPGVGIVREEQGAPRTRPDVERVLLRRGPVLRAP
jgi:hypothetical protein